MKFPITPINSNHLLRCMIAIVMLSHGSSRLFTGGVYGFGDYLNEQGFIIGPLLAWGITIFEIAGSLALLLQFFVRWIALTWALQLFVGIILVHLKNGWFVVGASTGGIEYSVTLIVAAIAVAAHSADKKKA